LRDIYQRRTAFRDESGHELSTCPIRNVKRAAVCVENADGALHNESMQFLRSNCSAERLAQAVEKIEDERLFDLNLLMRAL
jgi:hypothetical protein